MVLRVSDLAKDIEGRAGYLAHVFEGVSFSLQKGEFASVLAPRKSGKSMLLKTIAGIYKPTRGVIELPDEKGNILNKNYFSYIPSLPSSYPWLNVKQNLQYFLKLSAAASASEGEKAVSDAIELVGLKGYEEHRPDNRSLGFRFRVALARALVTRPAVILIDEPFNNIDKKTRDELYLLLREVFYKTHISILLSTSNLHEAVFLSDSVFIMNNHPSKIIDRVTVNLPVTRTLDVFRDDGFNETISLIGRVFEENMIHLQSVLLS